MTKSAAQPQDSSVQRAELPAGCQRRGPSASVFVYSVFLLNKGPTATDTFANTAAVSSLSSTWKRSTPPLSLSWTPASEVLPDHWRPHQWPHHPAYYTARHRVGSTCRHCHAFNLVQLEARGTSEAKPRGWNDSGSHDIWESRRGSGSEEDSRKMEQLLIIRTTTSARLLCGGLLGIVL